MVGGSSWRRDNNLHLLLKLQGGCLKAPGRKTILIIMISKLIIWALTKTMYIGIVLPQLLSFLITKTTVSLLMKTLVPFVKRSPLQRKTSSRGCSLGNYLVTLMTMS